MGPLAYLSPSVRPPFVLFVKFIGVNKGRRIQPWWLGGRASA